MKQQAGTNYLPFIIAAIVAIAIGVFVQSGSDDDTKPPTLSKGILLPETRPLTDVGFKDHLGQPFGLSQLQGRWSILFFGFTNCPDVCPATMQTLKQVKKIVSNSGHWENHQVMMVTVDPERDTTQRLGQYVPYFDPEFIGISASVEQTMKFAKNLGILFFKGDVNQSGGYDVDHGASLILINPKGEYAGLFSGPHKAEEIGQDLITIADSKWAASDANTAEGSLLKAAEGSLSTAAEGSPNASNSAAEDDGGAANENAPATKAVSLRFVDAWIRPAPPGVTSMAAYFKLANDGNRDIVISSVESNAFQTGMIHQTVIEDDVSNMMHMDKLTVPAGQSVTLAPFGIHLMLMGPENALAEGDSAEITLIDQDGERHSTAITVKQGGE